MVKIDRCPGCDEQETNIEGLVPSIGNLAVMNSFVPPSAMKIIERKMVIEQKFTIMMTLIRIIIMTLIMIIIIIMTIIIIMKEY